MQGQRPGLLLGANRILLHFEVARRRRTSVELICFDFDGRPIWAKHDLSGWLSLQDDHFLVSTSSGEPQVIDGNGETIHRWSGSRVTRVAQQGELIILTDERQVWAADHRLNVRWTFTCPERSAPALNCFVDGVFYWATEDEIRTCTSDGRFGTFVPLPADMINETRSHHKQVVGPDGSPDFPCRWWISFDESRRLFFLANALFPHMILCLDRSGRPRWCEALGPQCCGGLPYALPNGLYVASGGCNGILSWFDDSGTVLFQSLRHEGTGLAIAYSNLFILPDGRILVNGGPGLAAYSMAGEHLWVFGFPGEYCWHPTRNLLVGCYWRTDKSNGQDTAYLDAAKLDLVPANEPTVDRQVVAIHRRPWWKFWERKSTLHLVRA